MRNFESSSPAERRLWSAAAAGSLLASLALSGCSSSEEAPQEAPSSSVEASPSGKDWNTPAKTESSPSPADTDSAFTEEPVEETGPLSRPEFQKLDQISPEAFQKLSAKKRQGYFRAILESYNEPEQVAFGYTDDTNDPRDRFTTLYNFNPTKPGEEPSMKDSPEKLAQNLLYGIQAVDAAIFDNSGNDSELAASRAEKVLAAQYTDPSGVNYDTMKTAFVDAVLKQQDVVGDAVDLSMAPKITSVDMFQKRDKNQFEIDFTVKRQVDNGYTMLVEDDDGNKYPSQSYKIIATIVTVVGSDDEKHTQLSIDTLAPTIARQ